MTMLKNSPEIYKVPDVNSFLAKIETMVTEHEAEFSLMLGLCERAKKSNLPIDENHYFVVMIDGKVLGAAVLNPRNLILTNLSESGIIELSNKIYEIGLKPTGTVGPTQAVNLFSKIWADKVHCKSTLAMRQKIYELTQVNVPDDTPGNLLQATHLHIELVSQWISEFKQESLPFEPSIQSENVKIAEQKIALGDVFLWVLAEGKIVSMNFVSRPTRNGISIAGVYTPHPMRQQGYASSLVAHTAQKMLNDGKKFCVLYTDASNPTSNKIYQSIGFIQRAESEQYLFGYS